MQQTKLFTDLSDIFTSLNIESQYTDVHLFAPSILHRCTIDPFCISLVSFNSLHWRRKSMKKNIFASLTLAAWLTKMIRCYVFRKTKEIQAPVERTTTIYCTRAAMQQLTQPDLDLTCATKKTQNREELLFFLFLSFCVVSVLSLFLVLLRFFIVPRCFGFEFCAVFILTKKKNNTAARRC